MGRKGTVDGKRQGYWKEKKKRGKAEDVRPDLIKLIHLKFSVLNDTTTQPSVNSLYVKNQKNDVR